MTSWFASGRLTEHRLSEAPASGGNMKSTIEEIRQRSRGDHPRASCHGKIDVAVLSVLAAVFAIGPLLSMAPLGEPSRDPEEDRAGRPKAAEHTPTNRTFVFPCESWDTKRPEELGLDPARLDRLALALGGRGCVVKNGYIVKAWGSQSAPRDWFSSAKPVLSTLLLFALQEGKIQSIDQPIREFGWQLKPKDRDITFRQLANMTSGYARPERPGEAWSYNDFAIQLYQKTLFDRVYQADPAEVANHQLRLGALGLEDGLTFHPTHRRMSASLRDFARIAWFWLNRGNWGGKQLLPRAYFAKFMRPQVSKDVPLTRHANTDDYLKIGTYGGGSNHFSRCGPGIYGFNWWFNDTGRDHPDRLAWPDAPDDTFMSVGALGNSAAMIPSEGAVLVAAEANWGTLLGGDDQRSVNRVLKMFAEAVSRGERRDNLDETRETGPPKVIETRHGSG
jgi:CubicO group peptidase (beta-lactamase class C family)